MSAGRLGAFPGGIGLVRPPPTGGGSSRFFVRQTLGANATTVTVSGLDGDTDKCYRVRCYGPINAQGGGLIQLNGTAPDTSMRCRTVEGSVTGTATFGNNVLTFAGGIGTVYVSGVYLEFFIDCVRQANKKQMLFGTNVHYNNSHPSYEIEQFSQVYTVVANITSISIGNGTANALGAGFVVEVMGDTDV